MTREEMKAHVSLVMDAKTIAPHAELAEAEDADAVKAMAVADVLGPQAIDGRPSDYVAGLYDALLAMPDTERQRMRNKRRAPH